MRGRWLPPWHVLAGACLLAASLLHCLAGAATWLPAWLDQLEALSLASAALCLPRIALRAALALRRGVSRVFPGPSALAALFSVPTCDVHLLVTIAAYGSQQHSLPRRCFHLLPPRWWTFTCLSPLRPAAPSRWLTGQRRQPWPSCLHWLSTGSGAARSGPGMQCKRCSPCGPSQVGGWVGGVRGE